MTTTRSPEYLAWLAAHPSAHKTTEEWVSAVEYQAAVDEALDWQIEAHAEREFYDNDLYWFGSTEPVRTQESEAETWVTTRS